MSERYIQWRKLCTEARQRQDELNAIGRDGGDLAAAIERHHAAREAELVARGAMERMAMAVCQKTPECQMFIADGQVIRLGCP